MISESNKDKWFFRRTVYFDNNKSYFLTIDDEYDCLIIAEIIEGDFVRDLDGNKSLSYEDAIKCFNLCVKEFN